MLSIGKSGKCEMKILTWCSGSTHQQGHIDASETYCWHHLATLIWQEHALVRKAVLATFKRARKIESPKKADHGRPCWSTLEHGTSTLLQPLFFSSQEILGVTVTSQSCTTQIRFGGNGWNGFATTSGETPFVKDAEWAFWRIPLRLHRALY